MTTLNLVDQRHSLWVEASAVLPYPVIEFPENDPVPPKAMIMNPRIDFPQNSAVGVVEWTLRLYQTREVPKATASKFDVDLAGLLLRLRKGCGMGYVLQRVDPQILTDIGVPLPGYIVIGNCPLANC